MKIEDIPEWVPEPVHRVAAVYGVGHPMMECLLSNPVMEGVWKYFYNHQITEYF